MSTEPSAAEHTAKDVELLAKFCGMERVRDGVWLHRFSRTHVEVPAAWNPFVSADDDVEVLERVREVWLAPAREWMETLPKYGRAPSFVRMWSEFQRRLPASWEYTPGSFARTALAVLREMEEG